MERVFNVLLSQYSYVVCVQFRNAANTRIGFIMPEIGCDTADNSKPEPLETIRMMYENLVLLTSIYFSEFAFALFAQPFTGANEINNKQAMATFNLANGKCQQIDWMDVLEEDAEKE